MADRLILETSFLIDREREISRGKPGAAHRFLQEHRRSRFCITPIIAGEIASGSLIRDRDRWAELLAPFQVLPVKPEVSWRYGEIFRHLQRNGSMIETNDLWIAAAAVAEDLPLVTANERHFRRVPGLEVIGYR